jgi:hypothetical protein
VAAARIILLSLGCLAAGACSDTPSARLPEIGTDLYALAPDQIAEVAVNARNQRLWAFRWRPADPFYLVIAYRLPYRTETCPSGPAFIAWLRAVARLPITGRPVRGVDKVDPESPDWLSLRLTDSTTLKPSEATLFFGADSVLVAVGDSQYYAGIDVRAARVIRSGCAGLGAS